MSLFEISRERVQEIFFFSIDLSTAGDRFGLEGWAGVSVCCPGQMKSLPFKPTFCFLFPYSQALFFE